MSTSFQDFSHEAVHVHTGRRSKLTIIVAVHSTVLGPAIGGARLWRYDSWRDALDDALRLSQGMTSKNALAGLAHGGGKSVIMAPPAFATPEARRDAFLDLGDAIAQLDGTYATAEDVGTTTEDMAVIAERTPHVIGLPVASGGQGDPGEHTARGVFSATRTVARRIGFDELRGIRVTISGFGQVGSRLAGLLVEQGAVVTATDIDARKAPLVAAAGARWVEPRDVHRIETDIFMPAGVGGFLTEQVIDELACAAVVGPANNQLATPDGADQLARRGILYAPDYVVNAGGVIHHGSPEADRAQAAARIDAIGDRLDEVFALAEAEGLNVVDAADLLVQRILAAG